MAQPKNTQPITYLTLLVKCIQKTFIEMELLMGSNMATEMADGTLSDLGINLDIETQIGIHLRGNHYPPIPNSMIKPCIEAIDAVNDLGLWNADIELPEGVSWKGNTVAPASAIIEAHHLSAWIIERELD
jgi:hypothetical protein